MPADLPPARWFDHMQADETTFRMTLKALAEVNQRVRFVLAVLGPNRVGDPPVGLLGFMDYDDRLDLIRAADLAHRRAGHDDWLAEGQTVEQLVEFIAAAGGWRSPSTKWSEPVRQAALAYQQWDEIEEPLTYLATEGRSDAR